MGEGSSGTDPTLPPGAAGGDSTRTFPGFQPTIRDDPAAEGTAPLPTIEGPHEPATIMMARQPGAAVVPDDTVVDLPGSGPPPPPAGSSPPGALDVVRYGPGVPAAAASQAGAESVWRTGRPASPPPRQARLRRARRLLGTALTVILLAAAGVVLWLRFFHHPAFHVTGVHITQQTKIACVVDVTGRITTNGAAGTISYQWVYRPQTQAPQPLNQSVTAGQHDAYVTVAIEGQGHGSATQTVTLQVLGPDPGSDSTTVSMTC